MFPENRIEPLVTINPFSLEALGLFASILAGSSIISNGSSTWSTANRAFFVPFVVNRLISIINLFVYNGAAVSGNFDLGIFDKDGNRIISSGSTAQSGTSAIQAISVSATELRAGNYYMGLVFDNTTAQVQRMSMSTTLDFKSMGIAEQATAFTLPSKATLATAVNFIYVPIFGISTRSVV